MSKLKVESIQHPESSIPAITLSASGGMSGSFPYPNRNLLYNGAMQVAQRGTSVTGITAGANYTADRWQFQPSTMGTWTNTIESDGPSGSGFTQSWKVLCTTADAAPASGDFVQFLQRLEGQDLQRIAKGTASAQQLTLSFWVKSNVTGTYVATLRDLDNTRQVGAQYIISASATWEKKTITFPADTTGTFDNDNNGSFMLQLFLGAGTDRTSGTLRTTWTSTTTADLAVGQTNLASAINNYWQITGVQLETGSVATPFEHRSYGDELARCQRYYWRVAGGTNYNNYCLAMAFSSTLASAIIDHPVVMRTTPSSVDFSSLGVHNPGDTINAIGSITIAESNNKTSTLNCTISSGTITVDKVYFISNNNNSSGYLGLSAEL